MRVLVCIPCLMTGGTEIQTLSLVKALISGGYDVTTVCYFEHIDAMVGRYEEVGSPVILLSKDGSRPMGTKNVVKFLWRGLKKVVKDIKPDVAHVQYMAPGAIPIVLLRLLGVKRIIATAHTSGDIYPSLRLLHFVNNHILTAFQCITLRAEESFFGAGTLFSDWISKATIPNKRLLRKHGNHFTIYNCLPGYIQVRKDAKRMPDSTITIGVVSRLEEIKGMDLVIPAFAKVQEQFPNTRLLVVGDGSQRELMERQAREAYIIDSVEFAGRQPQDKLQDYYDKIDVLLMPSRSEGFGLTAIEGMARGCVPVVANTGGLPEVVQDGVNGLLNKPEDIEDMAAKISEVIADRTRLKRMSEAAIVRADEFSFDRYSESINQLYDMLG